MKTIKKIMMMAAIVSAAVAANAGYVDWQYQGKLAKDDTSWGTSKTDPANGLYVYLVTAGNWNAINGNVSGRAVIAGVATDSSALTYEKSAKHVYWYATHADGSTVSGPRTVEGESGNYYMILANSDGYAIVLDNVTITAFDDCSQAGLGKTPGLLLLAKEIPNAMATMQAYSGGGAEEGGTTPKVAGNEVKPVPAENTTVGGVFTNGVEVVATDGGKYIVEKGATVDVVFDAGEGYCFDIGVTSSTMQITASESATEVSGAAVRPAVVTVSVPLNPGYNIVAPLFDAKHETRDLQDVKLEGSEGWATETIYCFGNNGLHADQTYSWQCPDNSGLDDFCWIDDNFYDLARDVSYLPGQGFEMYADGEGLSVEVEVDIGKPLGSCSLRLQPGYNFVGNPYCAPISLQNFLPAGGSGWATEFVYFLDAEGLPIQGNFFTWQNEVMNNFESWVDGAGGISPDDMLIQPGKGFILYVGTELTLEIAPPTREELEKALNASSN